MRALAFLIGITNYEDFPPLSTPKNDIVAIKSRLEKKYGFEVRLIQNPSLSKLRQTFNEHLPAVLSDEIEDDRLFVYFAGHGIGENSEKGLKGYLIPADGKQANRSTWYSMEDLLTALNLLPCKHLLLFLDCCFGGTIRWASQHRGLGLDYQEKLSSQHYNYFTKQASRQVITSTAPNQTALDFIGRGQDAQFSPFAKCLLEGLKGDADISLDSVISTSELFAYLQQRIPIITAHSGNQQNVGLYALAGHENGEFLFFMDGFNPEDLKPILFDNPYKGLAPFEASDRNLFFGREKAISELSEKIKAQALTIVIGASGTGKSSLVKAGVLPGLSGRCEVMQPGRNPSIVFRQLADFDILVIDQCEQLITQSEKGEEAIFWNKLLEFRSAGKKLVITIRIDFERQLDIPAAIADEWQLGRYLVPPFNAEELREIIITPAIRVGRFIEPLSLVNEIIDEVIHYPGSLPLLSFCMQQLFEKCKGNLYRNITKKDYYELGGISGTLQSSGDKIYYSFPPPEQATMRNFMLRMVSVSGGEIAGKRVLKTELEFDDPTENIRIKQVVKALEEERLIHVGEDAEGKVFYEPSHDALVRTWKKVQDWVKEVEIENLLLHTRLSSAVSDFEVRGQGSKYLWHTNPNLSLIKQSSVVLNASERNFVVKSSQLKKRNAITLWSLVFAVIIGLSGLTLLVEARRQEAEQQTRMALANDLAFKAQNSLASGARTRAFRLAAFAEQFIDPGNVEVGRALHDAFYYNDHPDRKKNQRNQKSWSRTLNGHSDGVRSVNFSPDGRCFISGSSDSTAILWDVATGDKLQVFKGHEGEVISANFSPDGQWVLTGSTDGTARLWEVTTGREIRSIYNGEFAFSANFSPDGRWIVIGGMEHMLLLEMETGRTFNFEQDHSDAVNTVTFSPDSKWVVSGSGGYESDNTTRLWEVETGREIRFFKKSENPITSANFSPNGKWIVTGSWGNTATLWDVETGREIRSFEGHSGVVTTASFSPDGKWLLTGSRDQTARLWEVKTGREVRSLEGHSGWVTGADFSPDGQWILTASTDKTIKLWEKTVREETRSLVGYRGSVTSVGFSPNGKIVVTVDANGPVRLWDLTSGTEICSFNEAVLVKNAHLSSNGKWIFLTESRDESGVYEAEMGRTVYSFSQGTTETTQLSPDGKLIILNESLIELKTGRKIYTFTGQDRIFEATDFSPDGKWIVTGNRDHTANLWQIGDSTALHTLVGHSGLVSDASFSPDSRWVVTGSWDNTAKLWEVETGNEISSFKGHVDRSDHYNLNSAHITSVSFSPDSKSILTGSWDHTAKLWEVESGKEIRSLEAHLGMIDVTSFSPDGQWLLTGGEDEVRLWLFEPQGFLRSAPYLGPLSIEDIKTYNLSQILLDLNQWESFLQEADISQVEVMGNYLCLQATSHMDPKVLKKLYTQALQCFKNTFRRSQNAGIKNDLARVYQQWAGKLIRLQHYTEAKEKLEMARQLWPSFELEKLLYQCAKGEGTQYDTQHWVTMDKPFDLRQAAAFLEREKRMDKAILFYQRIDQLSPSFENSRKLYTACKELGKEYDTATWLQLTNLYDLQEAARIVHESEGPTQALPFYDKIQKLDPSFANTYELHNILMGQAEEFDARQWLASNSVPDLRQAAAYLHSARGAKEARPFYEKINRLAPSFHNNKKRYEAGEELGQDRFQELFFPNDAYEVQMIINYWIFEALAMGMYYFDAPVYKKMDRLFAHLLSQEDSPENHQRYVNNINIYGNHQLLAGDFSACEKTIRRGMELISAGQYVFKDLPLALLLQGKYKEARHWYTIWKDLPWTEDSDFVNYAEVFLDDVQTLKYYTGVPAEHEEILSEIKTWLLAEHE